MGAEKVMEAEGGGKALALEQLRGRLNEYESEMKRYLDTHEARVDTYKFSVEKEGDGYVIDIAVKASVHPRSAGISR